jgi:hypothetical protein
MEVNGYLYRASGAIKASLVVTLRTSQISFLGIQRYLRLIPGPI